MARQSKMAEELGMVPSEAAQLEHSMAAERAREAARVAEKKARIEAIQAQHADVVHRAEETETGLRERRERYDKWAGFHAGRDWPRLAAEHGLSGPAIRDVLPALRELRVFLNDAPGGVTHPAGGIYICRAVRDRIRHLTLADPIFQHADPARRLREWASPLIPPLSAVDTALARAQALVAQVDALIARKPRQPVVGAVAHEGPTVGLTVRSDFDALRH